MNHHHHHPFSITFVLLTLTLTIVQSANILIIVTPVSSYSHRAALEPLAEGLAESGHNVTFMAPFGGKQPFKNPNVTELVPSIMASLNREFSSRFGVQGLQQRLKHRKFVGIAEGYALFDGARRVAKEVLGDVEYRDFVDHANFDLLIVDRLTVSDLYYGLAWKLKAKLVTYNALPHFAHWDHYLNGIPIEPWVPVFDVLYDAKEMSLWDRCRNEVAILSWYYSWLWYHVPQMDRVLRQGYNESGMPSVPQLIQQEKIVLMNQHYSNAFPQALPPFVVPVGCLGVESSDGLLSAEVHKFVENSSGYVYVSFGTIITISTLPPESLAVFASAFNETGLRYLWKWEGPLSEAPTGVFGDRVKFSNWLPQNSVLGHPKCRGFINQGGQVSVSQAIHHGVPMIIFPVNGDQDLNAKRAQVVGNGIPMEFHGLTVTELRRAIMKVTSDQKMKSTAAMLSEASKHRLVSALDTAIWWTEFVLAQDDLSYLKPPIGSNFPWWSQRQLDVTAVFVLMALLVLAGTISGTVYLWRMGRRLLGRTCRNGISSLCGVHSHEGKLKLKPL